MNIFLYSTVLFCIEIISLFQYSLPYSQLPCPWCVHYITLVVLTHISFISTATYIELRPTITKVILIPVVRVSRIRCYCFHYSYSWLFLNIILHTHFSLHLYLKPFFPIQIPYKIRFKSKIHKRGDKERRKTRKTKSPFCSSKRTVCCFGKGIQLNLLT